MRRRHRASAEAGYSGIAAELGVYDDVFLCLSPGEPWLEHGIVEHRYKELCPTAYKQMIDRWGHVIQGPRRYSVTAFLTRTWARLAADGVLAAQLGPATGVYQHKRLRRDGRYSVSRSRDRRHRCLGGDRKLAR